MKQKEKLSQVWQWSGAQRRSDRWMNKAYINACGRLIGVARQSRSKFGDVLDVGSGSGLVLRHLVGNGGEFKTYLGTDLNGDGLSLLRKRAIDLGVGDRVHVVQGDITILRSDWKGRFDTLFSNFCLYTIRDLAAREQALSNIRQYLKVDGTFHIALPSESYSATNIAVQCFKDELFDTEQSLSSKLIRGALLVPYQWKFVLSPISQKVQDGTFCKFTEPEIRKEFSSAGLKIVSIRTDYGGCGYHVHGMI